MPQTSAAAASFYSAPPLVCFSIQSPFLNHSCTSLLFWYAALDPPPPPTFLSYKAFILGFFFLSPLTPLFLPFSMSPPLTRSPLPPPIFISVHSLPTLSQPLTNQCLILKSYLLQLGKKRLSISGEWAWGLSSPLCLDGPSQVRVQVLQRAVWIISNPYLTSLQTPGFEIVRFL